MAALIRSSGRDPTQRPARCPLTRESHLPRFTLVEPRTRLIKILLGLGLLGLLLVAGYYWGKPAYRNWRHDRALAAAERFVAAQDFRNAALSARQALDSRPGSVAACRIMAEVTERVHLPLSLQWRQRVLDLEPGNFTNRLAFARTAVLSGNFSRAAEVLGQVEVTNRNTSAFHELAAIVQMGLNDLADAEAHFSEAIRLAPTNRLAQLNRAIIRLQARDPQVVAAAKATLEDLYKEPECRRDALRHLAMLAFRNQEYSRAAEWTKELESDALATLSDRLLHLRSLQELKSADYVPYLAAVKSQCVTNAENANMLAAWLVSRDLAAEAQTWLEALPEEMQKQRAVILARTDCYTARKDWDALQNFTAKSNWGELDFLRLAMRARSLRELHSDLQSEVEWRAALRASTDKPHQLSALTRLAAQWGWQHETEELLWQIVQRHPGERWALTALNEMYMKSRDTRSLHKLFTLLVDRNPDDVVAKNNFATVSFLLNLQVTKAHQFAREAYAKATNNAAFASTYAYSLYLQGRGAEGLALLDALPPAQLTNSSIALYYGTLSLATKPEQARKYFTLAETGTLLPEEKELLADMRRKL